MKYLKDVFRSLGSTNDNIILTLSRSIKWKFSRVTFGQNSLLPKAPQGTKRERERKTSNIAFILILSLTFFWKGIGNLHAGKIFSFQQLKCSKEHIFYYFFSDKLIDKINFNNYSHIITNSLSKRFHRNLLSVTKDNKKLLHL